MTELEPFRAQVDIYEHGERMDTVERTVRRENGVPYAIYQGIKCELEGVTEGNTVRYRAFIQRGKK